jgi:hypothetical protein
MSDTTATADATTRQGLTARVGRLRLRNLETEPWVGLVVAIVGWALITYFSEPWGRLWGTGQDARCYYQSTLADPYLHSAWNDPIAYVYSPAFLQLVTPLTQLPWQAFMAVWTALLHRRRPVPHGAAAARAGLLFPFTAMEIAGGNVSLLLAVAIVIGFRWPAAWALVLLTKITPGIGLLWFAVRREWRHLRDRPRRDGRDRRGVVRDAPPAVARLGRRRDRQRRQGRDVGERPGAALDPPADRGRRRRVGRRRTAAWTVPVAAMLALPALWYGGISMLLAAIPLLPEQGEVRWLPAGARA